MTKISTDYRQSANPDTLKGGALTSYRMLYWLKDILCNFMSDPVNIKDDRICKILNMQDGATPEQLNALFNVGVAYSPETNKACTTPQILISLGPRQYPGGSINQIGSPPVAIGWSSPMYQGCKHKVVNMVVSVITEKHDSTVVFTDLLEDFMLINENNFVRDNGMISEFHVTGVSEPQFQKIGTSAQAKEIYVQKIGVTAVGGISWTTDTQGPVYRGVTRQVNIK